MKGEMESNYFNTSINT